MRKVLIALALFSAAAVAQQIQNPCLASGPWPTPYPMQNDGTTGTTLFKLADLSAGNAIISNHLNGAGAIGVVTAGAGTIGSACLAYIGQVPLYMDGTSTVGHCVVRSSSADGEGHDTGAACSTAPSSGEVIGIVQTASTGGGSLSVVTLKAAFNTPAAGGGGVSSFTGDGSLLNNSGSTGGVTATLANAAAHKYWGNNTGSSAAPGYDSIATADLPVGVIRKQCTIDNDNQSATPLIAAEFSGHCMIPAAATIVEVDVAGGTQTLTGSAAVVTLTGTSSVQIGKISPNGGANTTGLLSAALATVSGVACALTSTAGTCINGLTSSGSVTITTTALAAGDILQVTAATADAAQTWYTVSILYTIN